MPPVLTEQQSDQLDNIFAYDKASALRKMLKSGLFRKAVLPIDEVDKKGKGLLAIAAFKNAPMSMQVLLDSGLDIGDCGSYYFYYNPETNDWRVYSDCY